MNYYRWEFPPFIHFVDWKTMFSRFWGEPTHPTDIYLKWPTWWNSMWIRMSLVCGKKGVDQVWQSDNDYYSACQVTPEDYCKILQFLLLSCSTDWVLSQPQDVPQTEGLRLVSFEKLLSISRKSGGNWFSNKMLQYKDIEFLSCILPSFRIW